MDMDPFRYHDTNELGVTMAWTPSAPVPCTRGEFLIPRPAPRPRYECGPHLHQSARGGVFVIQSAPPRFMPWERMKDDFSRPSAQFPSRMPPSSPPNYPYEYCRSLSSSPSSSFLEGGQYSRTNSVMSDQSYDGPICKFCKKNGEQAGTYRSHTLHSYRNGRRVVECNILRRVRCPVCNATGDNAHTLSHCPHSSNRVPVALVLRNTARQCNGSLRKKFEHNF